MGRRGHLSLLCHYSTLSLVVEGGAVWRAAAMATVNYCHPLPCSHAERQRAV